jgi:Immunoglobulin-like domain of bacterial spore germination
MRPSQIRLVAAGGVLAVAIGVATAFVVGRDGASPASPAAIADTTTSTTVAVVTNPSPTTKPKPGPTPKPPADRDAQAAKAAAVTFLRELGMPDPVAATYHRSGEVIAQVGLHPRSGEGDRKFDQVTTVVDLHRYADGWVPTGAQAVDAIEVDQPLPYSRIESPVTVSGLSVSYEGTVHVSVLEDRRGPDRLLGKGVVNGGGTELAPFQGSIAFRDQSPGVDAGWVVFSGDTGTGDGIVSATAVRVRFVNSDHAPQILGVSTNPPAIGSARLVTLSGTGTLTVDVRAFAADEVRVLLVPAGTGGRPHARLLGVDTSGQDGERWSVTWRYPDESFHGHLLVQVNGRGGTAEDDGIAVLHE